MHTAQRIDLFWVVAASPPQLTFTVGSVGRIKKIAHAYETNFRKVPIPAAEQRGACCPLLWLSPSHAAPHKSQKSSHFTVLSGTFHHLSASVRALQTVFVTYWKQAEAMPRYTPSQDNLDATQKKHKEMAEIVLNKVIKDIPRVRVRLCFFPRFFLI